MLHITNGESANLRLQTAGLPGDFLAWDDPLHQGPLSAGLALRETSELRAGFIAECGWATLDEARQRFKDRDLRLRVAARSGDVVLWSSFELFDQLHLLQILAWFEQHRDVIRPPAVVWVFDHLGGGETDDDELRNLFMERKPIEAPVQGTAAVIWQALCESNPAALNQWSGRSLNDLPFMSRALNRLLEEYPWIRSGLSRTQQQALQVLQPGPLSAGEVFATAQALEQRPFMGDWSFWMDLRWLAGASPSPLQSVGGRPLKLPPQVAPDSLEFRDQLLELTEAGQAIVGQRQMLQPRGERWIGGVRIDARSRWFYDPAVRQVIQAEAT